MKYLFFAALLPLLAEDVPVPKPTVEKLEAALQDQATRVAFLEGVIAQYSQSRAVCEDQRNAALAQMKLLTDKK